MYCGSAIEFRFREQRNISGGLNGRKSSGIADVVQDQGIHLSAKDTTPQRTEHQPGVSFGCYSGEIPPPVA